MKVSSLIVSRKEHMTHNFFLKIKIYDVSDSFSEVSL